MIAFGVGALLLAVVERRHSNLASIRKVRWLAVLMAVIGLLGSNALYVFSMRFIPPAQANIISYLWPVIIVLLATCLRLLAINRRRLLAVAVGLAGASLVIGGSGFTLSWLGIGLALASAVAWSAFCVFRMVEGDAARPVLTLGFAGSALVAAALHVLTETTVMPSASSLLLALLVGILPLGLGAILWDNGLRRGEQHLLATMAYATPLLSSVVLLAFGFVTVSTGLVVGGILIVTAGFASGSNVKQ
jgi:drug/metabolite transporter (DMT)-like permease